MNRTNSVEPVFSQPLQVTYHQLLQNKTRIEDELYQTQRQLRRKEGEYLKKIAVYEQKIDQMQEQIDEFSFREENTKTMYEKILSALNTQDKQNYNIDMEKLQDLLSEIFRSHKQASGNGSSPKSDTQSRKNKKSFSSNTAAHQEQIESLEMTIANLNESYSKLKQQLQTKETENVQLTQQISDLSKQLSAKQKSYEVELWELRNKEEQRAVEMKTLLRQDYEKLQSHSQQFQVQLQQRIVELETLLTQSQLQQISLSHSTQKEQEIRASKDNKQKSEYDSLTKEKDSIAKERDTLRDQLKDQEQVLNKVKKQLNQSTTQMNEKVKGLTQKVQELEKKLLSKNEEIQKLTTRVSQPKANVATSQVFAERKNSVTAGNGTAPVKSINVGSKDQQVLVDIQKNDKLSKRQTGHFRVSNRSSGKKNQKMLTQPINININNDGNSKEVIPQNTQNEIVHSLTNSNSKKVSRNSNVMTHSSMTNIAQRHMHGQCQAVLNEKQRNLTPNSSRKKLDLNETMQPQSQQQHHRITSNQRKAVFDDSVSASQENKLSNQLQKYINVPQINTHDNRSLSKPTDSRRNQQFARPVGSEKSRERSEAGQINSLLLNESDKALLSSIEIEHVVRKMLDQFYNEKSLGIMSPTGSTNGTVLMPSQFHNMQTPSENVSFSMRQHHQNQEKLYSTQQAKGCITIDKEFLTKLENSLKKLTKSNEKIKQIMKEKDAFEQLCLKLRQKVKILKEDKNALALERENLIQQNHKMECKLKQAQVILNIEGDGYNPIQSSAHYDILHNASQKTLPLNFNHQRDVSPGAQSNLTLNIIQDHSSERYRNPPMSCRVNDSYDISLRVNPTDTSSYGIKRPQFHNTQDRSMLDQSLITIKRDMMMLQQQQQQNVQVSHFNSKPMRDSSAKFLPNQYGYQSQSQLMNQSSLNTSAFRGKTPTLQINLQQSPNSDAYCIGISTNRNESQRDSNPHLNARNSCDRDDSSTVITSRNFSRSTTNLLARKSSQHSSVANNGTNQSTSRQLFKYQSNRDVTLLRSPPQQNQTKFSQNNLNNVSGYGVIQKNGASQNVNASTMGLQSNHISQQMFPMNVQNREKSMSQHQPSKAQFSNTATSAQNTGIRRMNSGKAKDRYYTNNRNQKMNQTSRGSIKNRQQVVTFDEEDDACCIVDSHAEEQQQQLNQANCLSDDSQSQKLGYINKLQDYDEDDCTEDLDTDENNIGTQSNKSDSSMNIKVVPLPPRTKQTAKRTHNPYVSQTQRIRRDDGVIPSDERESDEESVQYKLLNNSNFIPSMHKRYVNENESS